MRAASRRSPRSPNRCRMRAPPPLDPRRCRPAPPPGSSPRPSPRSATRRPRRCSRRPKRCRPTECRRNASPRKWSPSARSRNALRRSPTPRIPLHPWSPRPIPSPQNPSRPKRCRRIPRPTASRPSRSTTPRANRCRPSRNRSPSSRRDVRIAAVRIAAIRFGLITVIRGCHQKQRGTGIAATGRPVLATLHRPVHNRLERDRGGRGCRRSEKRAAQPQHRDTEQDTDDRAQDPQQPIHRRRPQPHHAGVSTHGEADGLAAVNRTP